MKNTALYALTLTLLAAPAHADDPVADAAAFRQRLIEETRLLKPDADPALLNQLSYVPDASVLRALKADSVEGMLEALKPGRLSSLVNATGSASPAPAPELHLEGRRLTIVLVPGMFAEFIKNRAFEDVLEKPSRSRDAFVKLVAKAKAEGNPNATDGAVLLNGYDPAKGDAQPFAPMDLSELISMGELNVHGAKVRVILLNAPFSSGESLGDEATSARIFIRRLEKYLALTGSQQDLAFVGYSRGTPVGLEMLAQAKAAGKPWLANVRGMISLSGVVLGSSLADDATKGENSPTRKILEGVRDTGASLEKYPDGQRPGVIFNRGIKNKNIAKWAAFSAKALPIVAEMNKGNPIDAAKNLAQVDPRAPVGIFFQMWKQLGLDNWNVEYNHNIDRFNHFVDQLLVATKGLATEARVAWFKTHELPRDVTYYAIPAAMANPDAPADSGEKILFQSALAYGSGSYDDVMLVQNRKDYEKLSGGLALNDSQVSVIQAAFPARVIEGLNPANRGLKTKFLGVAGTHHWGMALREVNKMHGGQVNGFPREAMLRTLAVQVLLDAQ